MENVKNFKSVINFILIIMISLSCGQNKEKAGVEMQNNQGKLNEDLVVRNTSDELEFIMAIKSLKKIDYYPEVLKGSNCEELRDSSICCILNPDKNFLSKRIRELNEDNEPGPLSTFEPIPELDLDSLVLIKKIQIKGDFKIDNGIVPGARVEQWVFRSVESAVQIQDQLGDLTNMQTFYISKAPLKWFRVEKNIYFIITGGSYMEGEIGKIQKELEYYLFSK